MASGGYNFGRESLMTALDLTSDTIRAMLVDNTYTFSATETTMTTAGAARLGTDATLASKTVTDGVFDAANSTWTAVAGGDTVTAVIVFKFVTNDASSTPLVYIDVNDEATDGSNVEIQWDAGANKIYAVNG